MILLGHDGDDCLVIFGTDDRRRPTIDVVTSMDLSSFLLVVI